MTNLASNLPLVATIIYFSIVALLSSLAIHRYVVARASWRHPWKDPSPVEVDPESLPHVLLQLPLYNEAQVVGRLIDTVAELSYPRDRLTIQVLDDSTDETVGIAAEHVRRAQERGVDIHHVRRPSREGFKAGALAYGMELNDAPFIAILDADFLPQADFIEQLILEFRDHQVGAVQARWGHINREDSFLTLGQGALLDGHFINEHGGRFARDTFFNFNGTAGIWRRACIEDAGGWSGRTLTEDLDLSYRAQIKGWQFVFRPDVLVPAELPDDVTSFKVQQHRWAKGSIETALYVLPTLLTSRMVSFRQKYEALAHSTRQLLLSTGHFDGTSFALGRPVSDHDSLRWFGRFIALPLWTGHSLLPLWPCDDSRGSPSKSLALGPGCVGSRYWPGDQQHRRAT